MDRNMELLDVPLPLDIPRHDASGAFSPDSVSVSLSWRPTLSRRSFEAHNDLEERSTPRWLLAPALHLRLTHGRLPTHEPQEVQAEKLSLLIR